MQRTLRTPLAFGLLLAAALAVGCSEASPGGEELMSPGERAAHPVSEEAEQKTAAERRDRLVEETDGDPEVPGEAP